MSTALFDTPVFDTTYFTLEQREQLDTHRIPRHIAIIPDGNRRWARKQRSNVSVGHKEGADILMDIVKSAKTLGVKVMTFYGFSTENWTRSEEEVCALMWIIENYLKDKTATMIEHGIRLQTIGDSSRLSESMRQTIIETKAATADCDKIEMVLALNYGSRNEICRAVNKAAQENPGVEVTEELISRYLDTYELGDPELLIRTSGEMRISNFLLWQASYSEIYVCDALWPDFTPQHLFDGVLEYQNRHRRGGT